MAPISVAQPAASKTAGTTARRTPRTHARGATARVTERDRWLLEALTKMLFLTTRQIANLYFAGSRWNANKRLRRLFDAGLIQVWVRSLSEDNIYAISPKGLRVLNEHTEGETLDVTAPRGLDGNLVHLLAINQVRIALALGLPDVGGELSWWRSDWDLRAQGRGRIIVPDALLAIQWDQGDERTLALEVDNNTKSARRFLKKMLAYASYRQQGRELYGVSDFTVLVVGRDHRWVERYRSTLNAARLGGWIWFTTLDAIADSSITAPIWQPAEIDHSYSLRELVSLPYGKEGNVLVT